MTSDEFICWLKDYLESINYLDNKKILNEDEVREIKDNLNLVFLNKNLSTKQILEKNSNKQLPLFPWLSPD